MTSLIFKSYTQISIHWIIIVWDLMLGRYQKIHAKTDQHCRAEVKTALLSIWNDLPQEFIDKAMSFRKKLRSCAAAAGGHFEHSV